MADTPAIVVPTFRVILEDGADYTVQAKQPDLIAWDLTRGKHAWPDAGAAPSLWSAFVAWKASVRTGTVPTGTSFEAWQQTVSLVTVDDDAATVDPTQ